MSQPLNLTPARGPSVWDRLERESTMNRYSLGAIAGGAALIASVLGRPSAGRARRTWAATLGLACIAAGFVSHSGSRRVTEALGRVLRPRASEDDDAIDRALSDSFPASDAPASMAVSASRPRT
jgi:hypothetical protein